MTTMLTGKTVKIVDPQFLTFFFPEFTVKTEISFLDRDNKIIYAGKARNGLKAYLEGNTKEYINTVGMPEIDLTNKEKFLNFVYSKIGREPSKPVLDQSQTLDDEEFFYCCKVFWMTGRWPYHLKDEEDITIYDLFKSTIGSTKDLISTLFKLQEKYPFYVIESSFITFLTRAHDIEDQEINPNYKRLLKAFAAKSGGQVKPAIMKFAQREDMNEELKFLDLLLSLR